MGSDFKQKDEKDIKATLINCMNCQHQDRQINSYGRPCPPVELVKTAGLNRTACFQPLQTGTKWRTASIFQNLKSL